ncbi:MAG: hypothetical protein JKY09_05030 [Crocinitomicaceae bacterium]|nr:hypothetical protein [Crocinitomicaceae bacterium]
MSIILSSCDPSLDGDLKIFNESNLPLTVIVYEHLESTEITYTIQPNGNKIIKILTGFGNQKTYDCCPCELNSISISTLNGNIKKDPKNKDNWQIPNKNKQTKFGGENLKCEFHVYQLDI